MSVLECDRHGCDNVMCSRLSHERQEYICSECFEKLVLLGPSTDIDEFMRGNIAESFILVASQAYFSSLFPRMQQ
jgi:hypothetical protein